MHKSHWREYHSKKFYILINNFEKVIEFWLFELKASINPIGECTIYVKQSIHSNKLFRKGY